MDSQELRSHLLQRLHHLCSAEHHHEALSAGAEAERLTCELVVRELSPATRELLLWARELLAEGQALVFDSLLEPACRGEGLSRLDEAAHLLFEALA